MAKRTLSRGSSQTPEEVLETEIRELEQPMLRTWLPWLGGVGGLTLLVAVVFFLMSWDQQGYADRTQAGVRVELMVPRGEQEQPPGAFRWNAVERAASYVVSIQTERGETILIRPVEQTVLAPFDIELAQLVPGGYTWTVTARDAKGQTLGRGEARFRVAATE